MQTTTQRWTVPAALLPLAVGAALLTTSQEVQAQDDADEVGAANVARLAGDWSFDQINNESAGGQSSCELLGDHIVWCKGSWVTSDGGEGEAVFSTRYDPVEDVYWSYRFYANGYADSGRTWIDGNDWTSVYEMPDGLLRQSGTFTSDDTFEYVWHMSEHGGDWVEVETGAMSRR